MFTFFKKHFYPSLAFLLLFALVLFLVNPLHTFQSVEISPPEEPQLPQAQLDLEEFAAFSRREKIQEHQLEVTIKVQNRGERTASNISLEVPLLAHLDSPYLALHKEAYSLPPVQVLEEEMGSRRALFHLGNLAPEASATVTISYTLEASSLTGQPRLTLLSNRNLAPYLEPSEGIESDHPDIEAQVRKVIGETDSLEEKVRKIYAFVLDHMSYDAASPYRNQGALSALRHGSGVCEDYAALFVALCRAAGIPARQVNGYADPAATGEKWHLSPGQIYPLQGYRHSWAEFYVEGKGWLPADPSLDLYGSSYRFFGALPNPSHIPQNYLDKPLKVRFQGGQLAVTWSESLVGK